MMAPRPAASAASMCSKPSQDMLACSSSGVRSGTRKDSNQ